MNKKQIHYLIALIALLLASCTQKPAGYTITGENFDALNGKTVLFLVDTTNTGEEEIVDSVRIENGSFKINGKTDFPMFLILRESLSTDAKIIFLENTAYLLKGSDGTLANAELETNSQFNFQLQQITAFEDSVNQLKDAVLSKFYELDEVDEGAQKALIEEMDAFELMTTDYKNRFIGENPASPVSAYLLHKNMLSGNLASLKEGTAKLAASLKTHPYMKSVQHKIDALAKLEVGQIAPDFAIADLEGNTIRLSDYRGKYVLLDFWASWCMPCRKEFPHLRGAYKEFGGEKFDILGISLDDNMGDFATALEEENLPWKNASELKRDNQEIPALYAISFIPKNFLIDPDGKIAAVDLHGDEGMAQLRSFLSESSQ